MPTAALGSAMDSACSFWVHTEPAIAGGTPALAMPVMSCRRVIATSMLFLRAGFSLQLFGVRDIGRNSRHARLCAALKALGRHPGRPPDRTGNRPDQGSSANLQSASGAVNGRV